jgi:hypothetical protein
MPRVRMQEEKSDASSRKVLKAALSQFSGQELGLRWAFQR